MLRLWLWHEHRLEQPITPHFTLCSGAASKSVASPASEASSEASEAASDASLAEASLAEASPEPASFAQSQIAPQWPEVASIARHTQPGAHWMSLHLPPPNGGENEPELEVEPDDDE